jgi:hypothetical protein
MIALIGAEVVSSFRRFASTVCPLRGRDHHSPVASWIQCMTCRGAKSEDFTPPGGKSRRPGDVYPAVLVVLTLKGGAVG